MGLGRQLGDPVRGFIYLFLSLIILILVTPIATTIAESTGNTLFLLLHEIAFIGVLIASVTAISERGPFLAFTLLSAIAVGTIRVTGFLSGSSGLEAAGELLAAAFLGAIIALLLRNLFRAQRVSFNTIAASLSAYLIIAVWFAIIYTLLEHVAPGSILDSDGVPAIEGGRREVSALYFSFVTITTLGYGDITPSSGTARMLASVEALLGQIYLVVLVARLVGLHIAESSAAQADPEQAGRPKSAD